MLLWLCLCSALSTQALGSDSPDKVKPIKGFDRPKPVTEPSKVSKARLGLPRTRPAQATNDPIRFTLTSSKSIVSVNEPIELTISAELMDIPSSLMFFLEDASSFRLKVLPPAGFVVTGGTYQDLIGEKLSLKGKPSVSYTMRGYFEATAPSMCFRLLRGGGQADNSSLFVEKSSLCLQGISSPNARLAAAGSTGGALQKPVGTNNLVGACPAVTKVRYFARYDGWLERLPGSSVLGSTDNQTWTTLATITTAPSGGGWQEINLTNTTAYRYLRWQAGPNSYGEIKELEFYAGTQLLTGTQVNSNTAAFNNQTADYGPQNAFDGNTNTMWHTNSPGSTNYVGYDLECTAGSGSEPSTAINCYVITNKQSGQYLQATTSNTVNHVAQASGLANQVWQFETMTDGKLRISSADGANKYMYVDAYSDNQPIRLGPDNATSTKYRWVKELVGGTSYRVRSENMPWDQENAGSLPSLQIWGNVTTYSLAQTQNWDQFYFQSVSCPTTTTTVAFLTVNPGSLTNVVAGGTTQSISVNSNVNWSVSSSASWLTVSPASGSNSGSFIVTVQANPGAARTGSVSVTGGGITQPISIDQLGNSGDGVVSGNCYVIKSMIGGSSNTLQGMAGNTVEFQLPVAGQVNQIWKAEGANNSYKFISQNGTNKVMYVNSLQSGQSLLLGDDVTGAGIERYRWSLAGSTNNSFRVYGGPNQNTWDHAGAGSVNVLQLYGLNTDTNDGDWNAPYRRFSFTTVGCPTTTTVTSGGNLTKVRYYFRSDNCSVCQDRCSQSTVQVSNDNTTWTTIATLPRPVLGWQEYALSTAITWRYVRYVAASDCYGELLELEFYNGSTKLTGTPFGSNGAANNDFANTGYPNAFDGNTSTLWHGAVTGTGINYAGLDLNPLSDQLTITPSNLANYSQAGGTQLVNVSSNGAWSISGQPSWITLSSASGSGNGSFTLTIANNGGTNVRNASLTVTRGGVYQILTISQNGMASQNYVIDGPEYILNEY
ncbi:BACON domain-containing protein [Fibrella forsythiae]|uniref:RICIN domain-containing protein n=1 Tax=Fibrella forsythiae TaxID=2817061 RepID=A0ABS3JLI7_9BACT|nr:BACON domain-containing carbohydrate-binding protein [Fibrella forsythiae]MBO0950871.1 RICIN domain-containing protein [Fibrella forsythiae]